MHQENHYMNRLGWLRAAVLGADDGLISTSSLVMGVAASHASHLSILIAGVAGLVAGAMSMAAGEYVSVGSQADSEKAALSQEKKELEANRGFEIRELRDIYIQRGVDPTLAEQVALQLMARDALGAHAREELGITEALSARPLQAAVASAFSFALGALLPLLVTLFIPLAYLNHVVFISTVIMLGLLGGAAAKIGGADIRKGMIRVMIWGSLAMIVTMVIGSLFKV